MRRAAILQVIMATLTVASVVTVAVLMSGCGASLDDKYRARIGMCVEEAQTLAESKACRQLVDAQFGVYDGGVR